MHVRKKTDTLTVEPTDRQTNGRIPDRCMTLIGGRRQRNNKYTVPTT